jgi:hypothetical protein
VDKPLFDLLEVAVRPNRELAITPHELDSLIDLRCDLTCEIITSECRDIAKTMWEDTGAPGESLEPCAPIPPYPYISLSPARAGTHAGHPSTGPCPEEYHREVGRREAPRLALEDRELYHVQSRFAQGLFYW